ncbi:hypothetical protein Bca52824_033420 [Brassica carinata]|uniref:Uncharacterized protein n=1 Tax=Brassica carinata TaxID=52824 RepID=A0A8X7V725_BRACI|nr:hypothetical protein Bca52824_033420 [Brassica carinata]
MASSPSTASAKRSQEEWCRQSVTAKKRRCTKGVEGEPSGPLTQHRAKVPYDTYFLLTYDTLFYDYPDSYLACKRLADGLAESWEVLKLVEVTLKSTEDAHAAETSQLEARVSDLERDLGKSASALFKMKKEQKAKASEVRRLPGEIQSQGEPRTLRKKDLALAGIEGSLSEIQLLKGEVVPTLNSEEARLLS